MEQSDNTYTQEERKDIFEYVNNVHLHLKGNAKKLTKRKFVHTWKQNNASPGCYELFVSLYKSYETYDKTNEWFKQYLNESCETAEDYKDKKISLAKHRRITARRQEENDELQKQLEDMEEARGYIHEDEHMEIVRDIKKSHSSAMDQLDDEWDKKWRQLKVEKDKGDYSILRLTDKVKHLEETIKLLDTKD